MPAWSETFGGPLREDQIRDIASFIMNWESTALGQVELEEIPTPAVEDPVARGQGVFNRSGCGGCHTIENLSAGTVGPNLSEIGSVAETRKEGMTAEEYIRESILTPNAYIVDGFNADIMPKNFGTVLSSGQLDDLVAFLTSLK